MNKYLIITGGSRGIGYQTINTFLAHDWRVINVSRTPCDLPNVLNIEIDLSQLDALGAKAASFATEFSDPAKICLVHNAAHYIPDSLDGLHLGTLHDTLNVNLIAPIILNQMLIPFMSAGSAIIYIGSTLSEKAVPGSASYTISKHAGMGLMRVTCQDLAEKQIHTCTICPGLVETKLLHDTMPQTIMAHLLNHKVIGKRLLAPQEIADIIYFCAEQPSLNGTTIHANTGQVAD